MPANVWAVPVEVSGACFLDTLETSLFARSSGNGASAVSLQAKKRSWSAVERTLPACYGPANMHPIPLLIGTKFAGMARSYGGAQVVGMSSSEPIRMLSDLRLFTRRRL
jgi:hypothetical protein